MRSVGVRVECEEPGRAIKGGHIDIHDRSVVDADSRQVWYSIAWDRDLNMVQHLP